jgi:hypothetical protein
MLVYDCATGAIYLSTSRRVLGYVSTIDAACMAFPSAPIRVKNIKSII